MPATILIYGRERCPFTRRAREHYGAAAQFRDVQADPALLQEMLRFTGGSRRIPVLVIDGVVSVGFEGRS